MILHSLVAITATTLGSMVGLGGGVIIKPVLDAVGNHSVDNVALLSSITVFSMAVIAIIKQSKNGFSFDRKMVILSFGSMLGGAIGKKVFEYFMTTLENDPLSMGIQGVILAFLLILVYFRDKFPRWNITNSVITCFVGISLGSIASFLGIGGGPINVAVLIIFLGMNVRDAAVNSIFIILLSQSVKLCITLVGDISIYDFSMLSVMVPGAIIGGIVGSNLNKLLDIKKIEKSFNIALLLIIFLNFYNGYIGIIS